MQDKKGRGLVKEEGPRAIQGGGPRALKKEGLSFRGRAVRFKGRDRTWPMGLQTNSTITQNLNLICQVFTKLI
jgi:hypothetical protein